MVRRIKQEQQLGVIREEEECRKLIKFVTVNFILLWEVLIALRRNVGLESNRHLETIQNKYVYHANALIVLSSVISG
jgi:hypothetical protein